jgi:hypothetical protein
MKMDRLPVEVKLALELLLCENLLGYVVGVTNQPIFHPPDLQALIKATYPK